LDRGRVVWLTYAELTGEVWETTEPTVVEIKPVEPRWEPLEGAARGG
jgi:hypothetical protein